MILPLLAVILALVCPPAWALDWWVPSDGDAERVRAALAAYWPGADVQVQVGAWPGFGVGGDRDRLWVVTERVDRDEPAPADPVTRVVLLRAWLRTGHVPTVPAAPLPPRAGAPAAPPRPRWEGWIGVAGGPGFGVDAGVPPVLVSMLAEGARGAVVVGGVVRAGVGGVLSGDEGAALRHSRVGGLLLVGLRGGLWGGDVHLSAGPGARVLTAGSVLGDTDGVAVVVPSVGERLAWWVPVRPRWDFGVTLAVDLDDPAHAEENVEVTLADGRTGRFPPVAAALEVGVARRWGR